ncbi:hypothetical protein MKX03_002290, partial [Papaver bracteatum]
GDIVTPMKGINNVHNGVVNVDNGAVTKPMKGDYKKKNKAQMIHSNTEQDEQSKRATEFIFSSLSKSVCGRMDGGGPSGEKSTRGIGCNAEQPHRVDNGPGDKDGPHVSTDGRGKSVAKPAANYSTSTGPCSRTTECAWSFGPHPENFKPHQNFSFQVAPQGSSKVPGRRENRPRLRVKYVTRRNSVRSGDSSVSGDPGSHKKLKRSVEVRDEFHYKIGFGAGDSKDIQDKIQPNSGNESR